MPYLKKMTDIKSMTMQELTEFLKSKGIPGYRGRQLYSWIHEKMTTDYDLMTNLPGELRSHLKEEAPIEEFEIVRLLESGDGTAKFLFELPDKSLVESVYMEYHHGSTVCVSTQVGCAMNCSFCASGKDGFVRNLLAGEIAEEIYAISRNRGKRIGNVVFMGMGEPLVNYDNCIRAIRLLSDPAGLNISPRHMTLSTCGIVPGIMALAKENIPLTLAISLHAPTQKLRESIMPIAKKYPLKELILAAESYREITGRRITYEYCLIEGVNDSDKDMDDLANLLKGGDHHVNLIPYHRVEETGFSTSGRASALKNRLEKKGINVTIRRELGKDIDGACGQLRLNTSRPKNI